MQQTVRTDQCHRPTQCSLVLFFYYFRGQELKRERPRLERDKAKGGAPGQQEEELFDSSPPVASTTKTPAPRDSSPAKQASLCSPYD